MLKVFTILKTLTNTMSRWRDRRPFKIGTGTIQKRDRLTPAFRAIFALFWVHFDPLLMGQNAEHMGSPLPIRLPFAWFQNDKPAGVYQGMHQPVHGVLSSALKSLSHVPTVEVQHIFLVREFAA
jgi:hypothetical protein